jgi:ABC-type uncharacterized transport system permease subunit
MKQSTLILLLITPCITLLAADVKYHIKPSEYPYMVYFRYPAVDYEGSYRKNFRYIMPANLTQQFAQNVSQVLSQERKRGDVEMTLWENKNNNMAELILRGWVPGNSVNTLIASDHPHKRARQDPTKGIE